MAPEERTSGTTADAGGGSLASSYSLLHLRFGWWSLLLFLSLGIALETLHGFKIRAYLDVSNETRRLMWTLAHAHGTLLGLIHLAFSSMALRPGLGNPRSLGTCSICLMGASLLMPTGFFLGGVFIYAGDPGLGVMLVPIGAFLLLAAVFLAARAADALRRPESSADREEFSRGKPGRDKPRKSHRG